MGEEVTGTGLLDMQEVLALLRRDHGVVDAFIAHTGGGEATLYAGPAQPDPTDPTISRYPVAAGPGWFSGAGRTFARAYVEEFDIGPGDPAAGGSVRLSEHATERTAAAIIAAYARHDGSGKVAW